MHQPIPPRQRHLEHAWAVYDWANSVYSLVITSTIYPIYYTAITRANIESGRGMVTFFGKVYDNAALYAWSISATYVIAALLAPLTSSMAEATGTKKGFMKGFVWLGALSCMGLFFFTGKDLVELGIILSMLAGVGFAGSLVFYNSYLPEITSPDRFDRVSAKGFAYGYVGSVLLLVFNLILVLFPETFGMQESTLQPRISFVTVGLWWIGFSAYTFKHLPRPDPKRVADPLSAGFRKLGATWRATRGMAGARRFLSGYFFYNSGVQTVMLLATIFGSEALQLGKEVLIGSILAIQLVAIGGAYLFSRISEKRGNVVSIALMLCIWIGICLGAWFVTDAAGFVSLAVVVGLVMGGIQSLSRSTYSKFLPKQEDHSAFFGLYDFLEKTSIVAGTLLFGFITNWTGNMKHSLFALAALFFVGLLVVLPLRKTKALAALAS